MGNEPSTLQWDFGDGSANSTDENPTHQYTTAGTSTVTLAVTNDDEDVDVYSMEITVEEESGGGILGFSISIISIISVILLKKKH